MRRICVNFVCAVIGVAALNSPCFAENITYTYDDLGRLVALSSDSGQVAASFDPASNRKNYSVTDSSNPAAWIWINNTSRTEGSTLNFTVTRTVATTISASVDYATSDGSASAGSDYTPVSGVVSFAAGQTSRTISIATLDDALDEPNETVIVTLSNPSSPAVVIGNAEATGTIIDND